MDRFKRGEGPIPLQRSYLSVFPYQAKACYYTNIIQNGDLFCLGANWDALNEKRDSIVKSPEFIEGLDLSYNFPAKS